MIGSWLVNALEERGDEALILTRRKPQEPRQVQWDPKKGIPKKERLEGLDAVIHLTGAPIAARPWTAARRKELWSSRIDATKVLLDALSELDTPPLAFIGAGGLGYYGDRGEEELTEGHGPGEGFLSELAQAWEEAHLKASQLGCRTSVMRKSIVLSPDGGGFPLMVRPFSLGIGGWLGNGRQYTPWVSIRDTVGGYLVGVDDERCEGPVNLTIPKPTPNKEWSKALGRALNRPVMTHAPKWALRGALGDLADDLFLASVRAVPKKLLDLGFTFQDGEAEAAFTWLVEAYHSRA
ncbi:MAG: TIGR01777 family oxidoreductase [Proteobacteria bacterium]|nr:TIGR01777 family oxidoreductase [Pseudomonadota bacterium]